MSRYTFKQGLVQLLIIASSGISSGIFITKHRHPINPLQVAMECQSFAIFLFFTITLIIGVYFWESDLSFLIVPISVIYSYIYFYICVSLLLVFTSNMPTSIDFCDYEGQKLLYIISAILGLCTSFLLIYIVTLLYPKRLLLCEEYVFG